MNIKYIILITVFFALIFNLSCVSTGKEKALQHTAEYTGTSQTSTVSREPVNRGLTYELFLRLKGSSSCLKISMTSKNIPHHLTGKTDAVKTFFIVDQFIDIKQFKSSKPYAFSPLAKNYDSDWKANNEITICESAAGPIIRFTEGTLFRIRFTAFETVNYTYKIDISADSSVEVLQAQPWK